MKGRRPRSGAASGSYGSIEEQVRAVVAASFGLDEHTLPSPASRETISAWTSRSQMTLLLNLEQRFDVTFSLEQIVTMTSSERISEVLHQILRSST